MVKNKRALITKGIGIIGALLGLYLWKDYLPEHHGDNIKEWIDILRLEYFIFLYIPSMIALVASVFYKPHLMVLALLCSLPVTKFLGINGFMDTFPLVYYPLICYLVSFFLMMATAKESS